MSYITFFITKANAKTESHDDYILAKQTGRMYWHSANQLTYD